MIYLEYGDGIRSKAIILLANILLNAYKTVIRIVWGKKRLRDILKSRNISVTSFIANDLIIKVGESRYQIRKHYDDISYFIAAEANVHSIIENMVGKGDIFVDVGCNVGMYTIPSAKKAKQVIAIDANPGNIEALNRNIELNSLDNVTVLHLAISDKNGHATFYLTGSSGSGSLLEMNRGTPIQVELSTLDSATSILNNQLIKLVKIDVEGSEIECIKGGVNTLGNSLNVIIECHTPENKEKVMQLLSTDFVITEIDEMHLLGVRIH